MGTAKKKPHTHMQSNSEGLRTVPMLLLLLLLLSSSLLLRFSPEAFQSLSF